MLIILRLTRGLDFDIMKCVGLGAVADPDARVLILGTLPSTESLKRRQYYARKTNAFWWIMGELVGALPEMEYEERLSVLRKNGIALWDICHSAERSGSLDSKILSSTIVPNDLNWFLGIHSRVELICFNGRPAERMCRRFALLANTSHIRCDVLPSTSSAHAIARKEKLSLWRRSLGKFIDVRPHRSREATEN
jgi:double-stranded uracil-DNA glycosylase